MSYLVIPEKINWPKPRVWPPNDLVALIQPPECQSGMDDIRVRLERWDFERIISPRKTVFDLGCGYGRLACCLEHYLTSGKYIGFDVYEPFIAWLRATFQNDKRFQFFHINAFNLQYNPTGRSPIEQLPIKSAMVDVTIAISLFSHIDYATADFYFSELQRIMRPKGIIIASMFRTDDPVRCTQDHHRVVRLRSEWEQCFSDNGFKIISFVGGDNEASLFHDQWWVKLVKLPNYTESR